MEKFCELRLDEVKAVTGGHKTMVHQRPVSQQSNQVMSRDEIVSRLPASAKR